MNIKIKSILASYLLSSVNAFAPVVPKARTRVQQTHLHGSLAPEDRDRRIFIGSLLALGVGIVTNIDLTEAPGKVIPLYTNVAADIEELIRDSNFNKGPTLVRLAWHASGTYDKMSQTGGSGGGTMHFKEELDHGANAGLERTAVSWLEPIKEKYGADLSYADLYTLAGVVTIKTLGGPSIPWSSGRVDAMDPSSVTPDGRLPSADSGKPGADQADADHLRSIFGRMGFNDQEIVALSGAHALGRCNVENSGYDGPWTWTPTRFNNVYFKFLLRPVWQQREWDGPFQYQDSLKQFMMLPTDFALIEDDKFLKYVEMYADDEKKFFEDFSKAFFKLENLGTKNLVPTKWD